MVVVGAGSSGLERQEAGVYNKEELLSYAAGTSLGIFPPSPAPAFQGIAKASEKPIVGEIQLPCL